MSEIEEIRERWDYPNADKLDWNNAKDDIDRLLKKVKELESDLKFNASMLAKQTDLAREAEMKSSGWEEFAAQAQRNTDYYSGLLDEIAKNFGKESYISDDESVQDSPLRAKMPELVKSSVDSLAKLKEAVKWHRIEQPVHFKEDLKLYKVLDEVK